MENGTRPNSHLSQSKEKLVPVVSRKYRLFPGFHNGLFSSSEQRLRLSSLVFGVLAFALLIALVTTILLRNRMKLPVCLSKDCIRSASMLLDSMDQSTNPCDDFYKFTCGKWNDQHVTAAETNSWFSERTRYIYGKMSEYLAEPIKTQDPQPLVQAKSLYTSCVDTDTMDSLGLEPMLQALDNISLPRTIPVDNLVGELNLAKSLARAQRLLSMDIIVQLSMTRDNNTNATIMTVGPGMGLSSFPELTSLPRNHPHNKLSSIVSGEKLQVAVSSKQYLQLTLSYMTAVIVEMEKMNNVSAVGALALRILLVESQLREDMQKGKSSTPTQMTFRKLQEIMDQAKPSNYTGTRNIRLDWQEYLTELMAGLNNTLTLDDPVMVESEAYFIALAKRLYKTKPTSIQRYLWWTIVSTVAPHTTKEMRSLKEDLHEALYKRPRLPRQQKCVRFLKTFMNMAIGYSFANENDLKETSSKIKWMLKDIIDSFHTLVNSLPWMDSKTKSLAQKKASSIKSFIGYPSWILDEKKLKDYYKNIHVLDNQYLWSIINIKSNEVKTILSKVGEPAENSENSTFSWMSDPLEVNAFYGRTLNAVAIPAGILQVPFYFLGLEALNYGAIGSILGHELTHAFDIEGKDFDGQGNKAAWWNDGMTKQYMDRAQCFVDQYSNYVVDGKYKVNGSLTLAENIADNGGVREALQAYRHYVDRNGVEPGLPGFETYNHEQLFFLAYAHVWCEKTPTGPDMAALEDVHSPNRYRVIGTLSNLKEFSNVWGCSKNSKMNPASKCVLW